MHFLNPRSSRLAVGSVLLFGVVVPATAAVVTTKTGMQFHGSVDKLGSLNENPLNPSRKSGEVDVEPIVIVDDDLRRVFISNLLVASFAESPADGRERIKVTQRVATSGRGIGSIGQILNIGSFDEWGRRVFSMQGPRGRLDVIQGITEITPTYTKLEGLLVKNAYVWDMRVATTSIPRDVLSNVLMRQVDKEDADGRLRIVRLYMQAERHADALAELGRVIEDFPTLSHLDEQAARLRQLIAQRLLREIDLRQEAGQHARVNALLGKFPSADIAGETLLQVRDKLAEYDKRRQQYDRVLEMLETHIAELKDPAMKAQLTTVHDEIKLELSIHTLSRMADYLRLADDASLGDDEKVALAVSGWLLGSGSATDNLAIATSLYETRNEVEKYLTADRKHERDASLDRIRTLEGGAPSYVAKLIEQMKPPMETQTQDQETPGYLELTVPGIETQPEFTYAIQLPLEYHPLQRYPCVVTLHGAGADAAHQIDWWAGTYDESKQMRTGQATRRGYIVIAPKWTKPYQREYEFTAREHAAVLYCLRDACRRFSVDTDRVFLSGHSMGGDAAWDIGLSHPDVWAGVIPVVANSSKYINRYAENGRGLPFYFVGGEKDSGWLHGNGVEFDRYLKRSGFDCTIVQYQGRGHEHFQDEIQSLLEWMELSAHNRRFFPKKIEVVSMRPWDNYFWWLELDDFPANSMVPAAQWPPPRGTRPIQTTARVLENNRVTVRTGAQQATVWLSPDMIDFERRIGVSINGNEVRDEIKADVEVLLEDVRTRGDRQHPFWAKAEWRGRSRS